MNRNKIFAFFALAVAIIAITSCGATSHPNEKLIVGKWNPVKVEKIVDSSALQAAAGKSDISVQKQPQAAKPAGDGTVTRTESALDMLVHSEMRATMEIFANKTAIKNFPGKPIHATWKMKGRGTRLMAKNVENKIKFVIEILEINQDQIVVIEHARVGDIKITYLRQKEK